jgi:hypothetical protein
MIPHPGYGCIVTFDSGAPLKVKQYLITIGTFPECSCEYFKDMATKSLGRRGGWASCKHLYFVFTVIGSLKSERDAFIHVPTFSFNEVKQILESGILAYRIPSLLLFLSLSSFFFYPVLFLFFTKILHTSFCCSHSLFFKLNF